MKKYLLLLLPLLALQCTSYEGKKTYFTIKYYYDGYYLSEDSGFHDAIWNSSNTYSIYYLTDSGIHASPSGVWSVSGNADWCHYEWQEMDNGCRLSLSYYLDNNETEEERSMTITIRNGKASPCRIHITQYGIQTVAVSTPGTLIQKLADKNLLYATALKISGELNDKDISTIKNLSKIETLDLSEAIIADLPDKMFYENNHIKTVRLPETITTIHPETFAFSSLEYVYIPANVERIEDGKDRGYDSSNWQYTGAFANTRLKEVKFANNSKLTYIGKYAFAGAGEHYATRDHLSFYKHEITFPASVETIGDYAFCDNFNRRFDQLTYYCVKPTILFEENSKLKNIGRIETGGSRFNKINWHLDASNCTMIESVGYLSRDLTMTIGTEVPPTFSGVGENSTLYVPKGCIGTYYVAKGWEEFETIKEIGQE